MPHPSLRSELFLTCQGFNRMLLSGLSSYILMLAVFSKAEHQQMKVRFEGFFLREKIPEQLPSTELSPVLETEYLHS